MATERKNGNESNDNDADGNSFCVLWLKMNDAAHWIRRVSGSNEERADRMGTSMFDRIKLAEISNSDLANAVRKAKQLTSGSYSDYERNEKTLSRLLSKIMELSRKEGQITTYIADQELPWEYVEAFVEDWIDGSFQRLWS